MQITNAFTNPIGLAAARKQISGAFGPWGDEIWDAITYIGANGEAFRAGQIAKLVLANNPTAPSLDTMQQYVRAFVAYAQAVPGDFSGPASRITKIRRGWFKLMDNPEP